MIGNVVISKVDAVMCVVLSKEEKRALWGITWRYTKYEGRTESHEQQFFVKQHALLLTNQMHHLNLRNFLYFST